MTNDLLTAVACALTGSSLVWSLLRSMLRDAEADTRLKAEKANAEAEFRRTRAELESLRAQQEWLASRCGDTSLPGHKCKGDIGHVGTHHDLHAAWYGSVQFPKVAA